jgi:hypothetical protein
MLNAFAKLETIMKSKIVAERLKRLEQVETKGCLNQF